MSIIDVQAVRMDKLVVQNVDDRPWPHLPFGIWDNDDVAERLAFLDEDGAEIIIILCDRVG